VPGTGIVRRSPAQRLLDFGLISAGRGERSLLHHGPAWAEGGKRVGLRERRWAPEVAPRRPCAAHPEEGSSVEGSGTGSRSGRAVTVKSMEPTSGNVQSPESASCGGPVFAGRRQLRRDVLRVPESGADVHVQIPERPGGAGSTIPVRPCGGRSKSGPYPAGLIAPPGGPRTHPPAGLS
jgi:hypothetical protein